MSPFTLTTGVLLLVASSLAAPLLPRSTPSPIPQSGPSTSTPSEPYVDGDAADIDCGLACLGKSYAATAYSWISWPAKRSLNTRQDPSTPSEPYVDDDAAGIDCGLACLGNSYAATAHSWISWPLKRSLSSREDTSTPSEPYVDDDAAGIDCGLACLGNSYAATAHSWISWPRKRSLKARQSLTGDPIAATSVGSAQVLPKLRYPGTAPKNPSFASKIGWVRYDGRLRQ